MPVPAACPVAGASRRPVSCSADGVDTAERVQDTAFQNFTRLFLKTPEHTWGIDSKSAPASWDVWDNTAFREALNGSDKFQNAEYSWTRQGQYIKWSLQVCTPLPPGPPSLGPPLVSHRIVVLPSSTTNAVCRHIRPCLISAARTGTASAVSDRSTSLLSCSLDVSGS